MKLTDELRSEIECALDMRKKDGTNIWNDDDEIQVQIAGTFAADKFIVIKKTTPRVDSIPDPDLKPHHKYGEVVEGKPGTGWPLQ
tara:strand:+ start:662 stop:916 length:255 start_codon:yes stop_codon:yes gene_type:complete